MNFERKICFIHLKLSRTCSAVNDEYALWAKSLTAMQPSLTMKHYFSVSGTMHNVGYKMTQKVWVRSDPGSGLLCKGPDQSLKPNLRWVLNLYNVLNPNRTSKERKDMNRDSEFYSGPRPIFNPGQSDIGHPP